MLSYTKTVSNINSIDEDHLYEVEVIGADDESLFESLVDEGWSDQDKLEPTADVVYECDKLENNPEVLSCCGKIFKSKGSLTNHIRIAHTKDARYACRYCDSKFLHWNVRHSHETLVHERKRQFVCIFCDRKFYRKDKMQIHIKRHHLKEFKFECNLCDKKFVINRELKQHLQVHANCERGGMFS